MSYPGLLAAVLYWILTRLFLFIYSVGLRKGEAADLDEWVCPNCIVRMPGYQRNKRPTDDLAALVREGKCWPWPGPRRSEAAKRFKP